MDQSQRPYAINQDGTPVALPQSSVEIDIPSYTDPKRQPGATIKCYGPDGVADYALALRLANDFMAKRERLGKLLAADMDEMAIGKTAINEDGAVPSSTFPI